MPANLQNLSGFGAKVISLHYQLAVTGYRFTGLK